MLSKGLNFILAFAIIGYLVYFIYKMPKFKSGENAPNFSWQTSDGSSYSLSQLQGSVVLLDFWGSWCGPCRAENPRLVALHQKWGSDPSQFNIVSVGVEQSEANWQKAILTDRLNWPHHIYEPGRFKAPTPRKYGVKEIPTKYLIGVDGKVVFTNPTFDEIDNYLTANIR